MPGCGSSLRYRVIVTLIPNTHTSIWSPQDASSATNVHAIARAPALQTARKVLQRPLPGQEKILPAPDANEIVDVSQHDGSSGGWNRQPFQLFSASHDRINLVFEAMELAGDQPRLLDEFELPLDVDVQAHEQEPGFLGLRISAPFRIETATAPQDAVAVGDGKLIG